MKYRYTELMKTSHNQKGFSAVEAIIIVIAIGLLGFGGWYVWAKNKDKNDQKQRNTTSQQQSNNSNSDSATDSSIKLTTKLTSHNNVFSILLPDGWKFTNDTELDYAHAIGLDNMKYNAGTPAVVANEMGHRGGGITIASFAIQAGATTDLANYFSASGDQGSIKTDSGVEGAKYLFTAQAGDETLTAGAKSYGYKFVHGDKTVVMTYIQLPNELDQLATVEAAIKTFKFL